MKKILILSLSLTILFTLNLGTAMADDLGATDTVEKSFTPDIDTADLMAPVQVLSAPILSEEISATLPDQDLRTSPEDYTYLSN